VETHKGDTPRSLDPLHSDRRRTCCARHVVTVASKLVADVKTGRIDNDQAGWPNGPLVPIGHNLNNYVVPIRRRDCDSPLAKDDPLSAALELWRRGAAGEQMDLSVVSSDYASECRGHRMGPRFALHPSSLEDHVVAKGAGMSPERPP
jgi:hypothetical protein